MKVLDTDCPPAVPVQVAVCPICGEPIQITEIEEWETETGKVTDCGLRVDCTTAPEYQTNGGDMDAYLRDHWSMPYVDWLPVEEKVLTWLNRHYRIPEVRR